MDLIRRIANETTLLPPGEALAGLDDVDEETFSMHVIWMDEAGLIKASISEYSSGDTPTCFVVRLTWAGCEFVDAVSNDGLWEKAKREVMAAGKSFTFDMLRDWLKTEITQGFPTIRQI